METAKTEDVGLGGGLVAATTTTGVGAGAGAGGLLENLEERLNRIQAQLGIETPELVSTQVSDERSVFERTKRLTNTLHKIEKSSDFVSRFFTKYNQFVENFEATPSAAVSFDEKLAILRASEGILLDTAKSLEELQANEKYINFDDMGDVPSTAPKLRRLENLLLEDAEQFVQLEDQQQKLLESYNNITDILSQKFLLWDQALTTLEQQRQQ